MNHQQDYVPPLDPRVAEQFEVDEVLKSLAGWQKYVYFVRRKSGDVCVLKYPIVPHSWRDGREIDFYRSHDQLPWIPKIISSCMVSNREVSMEMKIDGEVLHDIKSDYLGNSEKITALMRWICWVLGPIWQEGITHRDIKPNNIIIGADGNPYVIDFGIAMNENLSTITTVWVQPQTLTYWSPEQINWRREHVDMRSDFFSLGILAYELLYWNHPFWKYVNSCDRDMIDFSNEVEPIPTIDASCPLRNFFELTLRKKSYHRARTLEQLLASLTVA